MSKSTPHGRNIITLKRLQNLMINLEKYSTNSYNSSQESSTATDCAALAGHVNTQIRSRDYLWLYYSSLLTVAGAALFNTSDGNGSQHSYDRYGGAVFGGRQGFTPIITAVYDDDDDGDVSLVQFACMQVFKKSGDVLEDIGAASFHGNARVLMLTLAAVTLVYVMLKGDRLESTVLSEGGIRY
ncbi:hypothetical protein NPX13_g10467 [Xylaria arbuscula]|uniref:Uncharacterized protein n=1 Tax=Xylaria arbuscula TaxID=114810 RepID=A0A9W8N4J6_9PEZI|nr:hypothetical protein NPX13_g10467 [Xylaria arbuscula]